MPDDNWIHWFVDVEDSRASFVTNLKFRDERTREGRALVVFRVVMETGAEFGGLGSNEERSRLLEMAQKLETLPVASNYQPVSSVTHAGSREFAYAVDRLFGTDAFGDAVKQCFEGYRTEPAAYLWTLYNDWFNPRPQDERWAADESVVANLKSEGDLLHVPRRVDHWLFFPSRKAAEAALQRSKSEGYKVFEVYPVNDEASEWGLHVHHVISVDIDTVWKNTTRLSEIAEEFGGEYDGWETFFVTEAPATPDGVAPDPKDGRP